MGVRERYSRNMAAFSREELERISSKQILVVGCGGLGGYLCQSLARFGVGRLTLVDGDAFSESNLNRQIFATMETLGQNKAVATRAALQKINPDVEVVPHPEMLSEENAPHLFTGQSLAVDCLDNLPSRFLLAAHCGRAGIPLVHGAVGGFYGHVANIFPGEQILEFLYPGEINRDALLEKELGIPPHAPQLVSAIQCCEALKILAGRKEVLRGEMLHIDMLHNHYETVPLCAG